MKLCLRFTEICLESMVALLCCKRDEFGRFCFFKSYLLGVWFRLIFSIAKVVCLKLYCYVSDDDGVPLIAILDLTPV